MTMDEAGTIWLSNLWLAGALIVLAVGLVLWCHRWLETGRAPAPRSLPIQAVRLTPRQRRPRPERIRPTIVARSGQLATRRSATRLPRSAA